MLPLILTRSLDLSVSSTIALSSLLCAKFYLHNPSLGVSAIPMFIGVGLLVGAVNAIPTKAPTQFAHYRHPGNLVRRPSLAEVVSNGGTISGMPNTVLAIANNYVLGIPLQVLVIVGCGAAMAVLLRLLKWGRWIYAIGGNPDAADRVGIPVAGPHLDAISSQGHSPASPACSRRARPTAATRPPGNSRTSAQLRLVSSAGLAWQEGGGPWQARLQAP